MNRFDTVLMINLYILDIIFSVTGFEQRWIQLSLNLFDQE